MKKTIKTLALFTTGLVVGVVVGRVKGKKHSIKLDPLKFHSKLVNGHSSFDQVDKLQEIIRFQDEMYRRQVLRDH